MPSTAVAMLSTFDVPTAPGPAQKIKVCWIVDQIEMIPVLSIKHDSNNFICKNLNKLFLFQLFVSL